MQLASLAHFIQLLRRSAIHTLRVKFSFWAIPLEAWILGVVDQRWHLWQARIEFSRYHQNWWWIYIYIILYWEISNHEVHSVWSIILTRQAWYYGTLSWRSAWVSLQARYSCWVHLWVFSCILVMVWLAHMLSAKSWARLGLPMLSCM